MTPDDALDRALRIEVYRDFADRGEPPSCQELVDRLGATPDDVQASLDRLAASHVLVLEPGDRARVRMAMPFSAVPTAFRVRADDRAWWANCIWDALGIAAALHRAVSVHTTCADCGDELVLDVSDDGVAGPEGVLHFLVPARRFWDDVVFT